MANITNLEQFLTDVATAIRTKKETTGQIPAENFDQEILSIDTIKGQEKTIIPSTSEQIVIPDGDYNAITKATIKAVDNTIDGNITPENIKKNINILGVTGTLEEGTQINNQDKEITENGTYTADEGYTGLGTVTVNVPSTGDVPVKLFETQEAMQADTTAKEGDLAVVYRNEVKNATVDSKFQTAIFPQTVVLDTAMTDYVDIMYRPVDSSAMFDCFGQLDSSGFMMDCYTENGSVRIQYESSDGITYTRTDTTGNPVDFGTEIYYYRTEQWNDAIGKFIQAGGMYFEGLYEYTKDENKLVFPTLASVSYNIDSTKLQFNGETINTIYDVSVIKEIIAKMNSEITNFNTSKQAVLYINNNNQLCIIPSVSSDYNFVWTFLNNNDLFGIRYGNSSHQETSYVLDLKNKTYSLYKTLNDTAIGDKYCIPIEELNTKSYWYIYNNSNDKKITFELNYENYVDSAFVSNVNSTNVVYGNSYKTAKTQLTLSNTNQLLPGKIAYGKNGIVEGDGSIYNNLNYRNIIGSYIPAYTFVSTLGNDNGKKLVHSNNINDNGIWKTTVISKENSGFGYNFYGRFEDSAGTVFTATKNYIITVEKIIGDNNDSHRIWNIYDKHGSLLYNFTQNTNVDKRWATIFAIELTDGRLLYASHNWNEAWSSSGGSQTIISGYIDTKNGSHTEVNYTWSGEQFMPEGIWYDGTDYYIGVASWSNNLIILKNGKLWVNATSTAANRENYYGGHICGDDTYIYMTAGTNTTPIIVVNKQTKAVSVINSSVFDNKRAYIGYDTDTNKCYVTANKKLYSLSGTSTRVIATLTRNIAISSIFRYKNINGKVLCISNYGAYQCNVTDDISTTYSLERFSGYDDCYNDTYIIETQDNDNVYISQLLCGVTTDSGSINDKFLAFNTEKSPINNKANTYMILSNEIDDYTPYTISQEEYNTALNTANEILGEEV